MDTNTTLAIIGIFLAIIGIVLSAIGAQVYLKYYFWSFIRHRNINLQNLYEKELEKITLLRNDAVIFNAFAVSQLFKFLTLFIFIMLVYGLDLKEYFLVIKVLFLEVLLFIIGFITGETLAVVRKVRNFLTVKNKLEALIEKHENVINKANVATKGALNRYTQND